MKTVERLLFVLLISALVNGCAIRQGTSDGGARAVVYGRTGSAGANYDPNGGAQQAGRAVTSAAVAPVAILYHSRISFDTNIYPSVDLALGRMLHGDHELQEAMQQFVEPGFRLLENKYGLVLPRPQLEVDAQLKTIRFRGKLGPLSEVTSSNPTIGLLGIAKMGAKFRTASVVDEASATFISLDPRSVNVKTLLSIRIEYFDAEKRAWFPAEPEKLGKDRLARALTNDITRVYREFLRARYGITITGAARSSTDD